jgi:hypothetical protein
MGVDKSCVEGVSAVLTVKRFIGERLAVSIVIDLLGRVEIVMQLSVSIVLQLVHKDKGGQNRSSQESIKEFPAFRCSTLLVRSKPNGSGARDAATMKRLSATSEESRKNVEAVFV